MNNKTVLITGCAGLLGSRLADWIIENEPHTTVVGIDDLSGGYMDNVNPNVRFQQIDLALDRDTLEKIFIHFRPDVVYHFAAYAAEALSPFIRTFNYTNNLLATSNLINCSIKYNVKRFVFTSSMAVYGDGIPPFSEDMVRNPIDPYGVAKMACEMDLEIAGHQHGLDWCIIRPHNMYGAKQNIWDSYRNVLGIWMYKKLNDQPFTIFGDGEQTRAFSYIDDSVECLWKAGWIPAASKQIINLGGIQHTSIKDAAHILADVVGGAEIIHLPPRHEVKHAFPTWEKSVSILGFEHKTDLREGLTKMWEWVKQQPIRPRQIWSEYELDKGIYDYWKKDTLVSGAQSVKEL
jgi:UDP-glucose 4-epimerase